MKRWTRFPAGYLWRVMAVPALFGVFVLVVVFFGLNTNALSSYLVEHLVKGTEAPAGTWQTTLAILRLILSFVLLFSWVAIGVCLLILLALYGERFVRHGRFTR